MLMSNTDIPIHVDLQIQNENCQCIQRFNQLQIPEFEIIDVRGFPNGLTQHLVRIPSKFASKLPENLGIQKFDKLKQSVSICFDSDGCGACSAILSENSFLISGKHLESNTLIYSFIAPNFQAFQGTIRKLEATGFHPKILRSEKLMRRSKILTEKQERMFWYALKLGFFEYPRKIHMNELAQKLGISMSTLSEILRRGMRNLLTDFFKEK